MFPHNFIENKSQEEFTLHKNVRRNSRATLCTWCSPPPSSTSSSPFSPSSSSTPGSPSSSWSPPSSSSYSLSFWPGSDWLCRGTKCNVVQLPAVEGASATLKGLERRKVWTKIYHIYISRGGQCQAERFESRNGSWFLFEYICQAEKWIYPLCLSTDCVYQAIYVTLVDKFHFCLNFLNMLI